MKILFVCLGNICRSPLGEGILRHKAERLSLDWTIDSAGTGGWHSGEKPDPRSIAIAKKNGVDISYQKARQFLEEDFEKFDLILAMDKANRQDLLQLAKTEEAKSKVQLILENVKETKYQEVPDPYYDNRFELVFELIAKACDSLIEATIPSFVVK